jgi:hypothetical protein
VAAYLRRRGDRVALVVANLGTTPLTGVALTSAAQVLPPGRYAPATLLSGRAAAPVTVEADGQMRDYVPLSPLAPLTAYVFDISSEAR